MSLLSHHSPISTRPYGPNKGKSFSQEILQNGRNASKNGQYTTFSPLVAKILNLGVVVKVILRVVVVRVVLRVVVRVVLRVLVRVVLRVVLGGETE